MTYLESLAMLRADAVANGFGKQQLKALDIQRSHQKLRDLEKRDGYTWVMNPNKTDSGMSVPPGWIADFERGYPVYPMKEKP